MSYQRQIKAISGALIAFGMVLILLVDSILNYPMRLNAGVSIPWSAICLPGCLTLLYLNRHLRVSAATAMLGFCCILCFGVSFSILPSEDLMNLIQLPLIVPAFFLGSLLAKHHFLKNRLVDLLTLGIFLHALIALAFLLRVIPFLPGELSYFMAGGELYERPAYTTDQNYQILYWTMAPPIALLASRPVNRYICILACLIFVPALFDLGTRSGLLVFALSSVLSVGVFFVRNLQKFRIRSTHVYTFICVVPVIVLASNLEIIGLYFDQVLDRVGGVIARTESYEGAATIGTRFSSFFYSVENFHRHIIPQGLQTYLYENGIVPHSAPTTLMLLYGWVGLLLWLIWFAFPSVKAGSLLLTNRGTSTDTIIAISLLLNFIATLSLPSPLTKLNWLLAGYLWHAAFSGEAELQELSRRKSVQRQLKSVSRFVLK